MQSCKKYQPSPTAMAFHSNHLAGGCRSCVYFSHYNCGSNPQSNPASTMMSLNTFAFDS
ncbi:MAG: hypothetical protein FWE11_03685 [Defluviitaleaceae bacterium]|nr:hypothetical protein [Defluviitaleaceae bacterium]